MWSHRDREQLHHIVRLLELLNSQVKDIREQTPPGQPANVTPLKNVLEELQGLTDLVPPSQGKEKK